MNYPDKLSDWLLLQSVDGLGARTYTKLIERFQSPAKALQASPEALLSIPRFPRKLLDSIRNLPAQREEVEALMLRLQDQGVYFTTRWHDDYPALLRQVENPPAVLSLFGAFAPGDAQAVAIVGARAASERGLEIAEGAGRRLAEAGITIVSGYARGIDTAGHLGAIRAQGRTVMVLSHGISHFRLRDAGFESKEYLEQRGVILSEYFPTVTWTAGAAMARNRIVVGLAKAILVVECTAASGTMDTARRARKAGKPLFVVEYRSQQATNAGNQTLLQQGATPIRTYRDLDKIIAIAGQA